MPCEKDNVFLYKFVCGECDAEYVTEDEYLVYCDSGYCVDRDVRIYGPYLLENG